jgi:hypothetical protein
VGPNEECAGCVARLGNVEAGRLSSDREARKTRHFRLARQSRPVVSNESTWTLHTHVHSTLPVRLNLDAACCSVFICACLIISLFIISLRFWAGGSTWKHPIDSLCSARTDART